MKQKYLDLLNFIEPFIICSNSSLAQFNLSYMDLEIKHIFNPIKLRSHRFIEKLYILDQLSFGDNGMGMPRWVMFDCAMMPGAVIGFGTRGKNLSSEDKDTFNATDDDFIPLSMYIAIPCADGNSWFGHNLSSLNNRLSKKLNGLGLLTKYFALGVLKIQNQIGATQWDSNALGIHLKLSPLEILSSYTPVHTKMNTLCYRANQFYSKDRVLSQEVRPSFENCFENSIKEVESVEFHKKLEKQGSINLIGMRVDEEGRKVFIFKQFL